MKVIKPPPAPPWSQIQTCHICKAELEIEADDLRYEQPANPPEHGGGFYFATCPIAGCRVQLQVGMATVPWHIRRRLGGP